MHIPSLDTVDVMHTPSLDTVDVMHTPSLESYTLPCLRNMYTFEANIWHPWGVVDIVAVHSCGFGEMDSTKYGLLGSTRTTIYCTEGGKHDLNVVGSGRGSLSAEAHQ